MIAWRGRIVSIAAVLWLHYLKSGSCGLVDMDLIEAFLEEKSLSRVVFFGCFSKSERIFATKTVTKFISINLINIDRTVDSDLEKFKKVADGFILDGHCEMVGDLLAKAGTYRLLGRRHKWLIISNTSDITRKFETVVLNIDADINIAVPKESSGSLVRNWTVLDVYNPAFHRNGKLVVLELGFYNTLKGYRARRRPSKYWMRRNLTGVTFKTWIVLPESFEGTLEQYLRDDTKTEINTFNRFHHRVIENCKHFYNYSTDIQVSKSWGYKTPDGTFDGMVGALQRQLIDFGSSPLFIRTDRGRVIDYGRNTWILRPGQACRKHAFYMQTDDVLESFHRAAFMFKNQKAMSPVELFLQPLSATIWLSTFGCSLLAIFVLRLVLMFEKSKLAVDKGKIDSWSISVLFAVDSFCQQGSVVVSDGLCGRILSLFVYILSLVVYQFYTASMVSHLLIIPNATISTVEGLVKSSLKVGCQDILYDKDYFKYTTDKWHKEIFIKKITDKSGTLNYLPPEQGLSYVQRGGYAFNIEVVTAYPIIRETFSEKDICELVEVQLLTQQMNANYQKGSPFKDLLDVCLQRLAEHGIIYKERKFWHPPKPPCVRSSRSITFHVPIDEFYPALILLLIGIILSLIILGLEILYHLKYDVDDTKIPGEPHPFVN